MTQLISNEKLRTLCIKNNWFTEGSNSQYAKLFYANDMGCNLEELVTIIWLCSDAQIHSRRDIKAAIEGASDIYYPKINNNEKVKQLFRIHDLKQWQVAQEIGITSYTLSVWLRHELSDERLQQIRVAVSSLCGKDIIAWD